ncbi:MAG: hypothetical protein HPY66_2396 [Firmicutes bacterium]|nr:hypothetical protein [Bacillota bacterium]MDI6706608.1 DUF421 domain-containing protein [Bacillota bacterium]
MQSWLNVLLRSVALFFIVALMVRLIGKKHPSRMPPVYYISYIVIAIIASMISLDIVENTVFGFIALGVWFGLLFILDYLALKSKWMSELVNGKETILVKQGKIMEENLIRVRMTGEELLRGLRSKNVFNLADVEFAIMETTGDLNVMLKSDKKPVTPHDLEWKVAPQAEPQTVILDGNILDEPLANLGLNREWLEEQLEHSGVSLDNVFVGQVDSSGDLYLDLFNDAVQLPQPKVKELLFANLQKCQADIAKYALETNDKTARKMYMSNAKKLESLNKELEPYLMR